MSTMQHWAHHSPPILANVCLQSLILRSLRQIYKNLNWYSNEWCKLFILFYQGKHPVTLRPYCKIFEDRKIKIILWIYKSKSSLSDCMIVSTFSLFFLQRQEVLEILQYYMYLFLPYILSDIQDGKTFVNFRALL